MKHSLYALSIIATLGGCDELFGFDEVVSPRGDAATSDTPVDGPRAWSPPVTVTLEVPDGYHASDVTLPTSEDKILYSATDDASDVWDIYEAPLPSPITGGSRVAVAMSAAFEASPELSPDGETLYFLTFETGSTVGEINQATLVDGVWTLPVRPADLNRPQLDDRPGSPDATGTFMVTSRDNRLQEMRREGTWTTIDTCDAINNALPLTRNPHLSPDGLRLVFGGAIASGAGLIDLYVAHREVIGEPWSPPQRLSELSVDNVDDGDPWMSADGTRIWFNRGQTVVFSEYR